MLSNARRGKEYMTKEELFTYIKDELNGCSGYAFIDRALAELDAEIKKHKTFNCDEFKKWFHSRNVSYRISPISFLTKCGMEDIKKGNFDDNTLSNSDTAVYCAQHLFNAMRNRGINVLVEDTVYINLVEAYILKQGLMTLQQLIEWNHQAVDCLANKGKTSKDFIFLFKNTKAMRALKLPFNELEKEIKKFNDEWNALIKKIKETPVTAITDDNFLESETNENEETRRNDNPPLDTL